jgi:hypothetical protein
MPCQAEENFNSIYRLFGDHIKQKAPRIRTNTRSLDTGKQNPWDLPRNGIFPRIGNIWF